MKKTAEEILENITSYESDAGIVYSNSELLKAFDIYATQYTPTPTEAEINEAAINNGLRYGVGRYIIAEHVFKHAIQWFQQYQTQGREKPVLNSDTIIQMCKESLQGYKDEIARGGYSHSVDDISFNTGYQNGFFDGKSFESSQPNPAIAVIEAYIEDKQKKYESDSFQYGREYCTADLIRINEAKYILTILKEIKG